MHKFFIKKAFWSLFVSNLKRSVKGSVDDKAPRDMHMQQTLLERW